MALGAQRSDVLKLVLSRSLKLISAGTIIGLIVALMSTHTLRALLYSVSAFDMATFGFGSLGILLIISLAVDGKARRARRFAGGASVRVVSLHADRTAACTDASPVPPWPSATYRDENP